VVPISFVSDHVETLAEIDHCAREESRLLGIERFAMTQGLNDSPKFISALAGCVLEAIGKVSDSGNTNRDGAREAALSMAAD
jgi:ferrochelatase